MSNIPLEWRDLEKQIQKINNEFSSLSGNKNESFSYDLNDIPMCRNNEYCLQLQFVNNPNILKREKALV